MDLKKARTEIGKHEAARRANKDCLKHSLEIGRMLCKVKKDLPHGEFMAWCKSNTSYRRSQLQRFMQLPKYPHTGNFNEDIALLQHFRELNRGKRNKGNGKVPKPKDPEEWEYAFAAARISDFLNRELDKCPKEEFKEFAHILRSFAANIEG